MHYFQDGALHCCVPHCNNDGRKKSDKELRFFNFPTEKKLRQAWQVAIRSDESQFFKVCIVEIKFTFN